jgi:hypothetical protein
MQYASFSVVFFALFRLLGIVAVAMCIFMEAFRFYVLW